MSMRGKVKKFVGGKQGPQTFVYYMSMLEESPCSICFVQPVCKKTFEDNSACDKLEKFIKDYIEKKEKENEN